MVTALRASTQAGRGTTSSSASAAVASTTRRGGSGCVLHTRCHRSFTTLQGTGVGLTPPTAHAGPQRDSGSGDDQADERGGDGRDAGGGQAGGTRRSTGRYRRGRGGRVRRCGRTGQVGRRLCGRRYR